MAQPRFLAIDLGAESGRGMVGEVKDGRLTLTEIHRFHNRPSTVFDSLHWDVLSLHEEIKDAIAKATDHAGEFASIGVDTWAVDFGLLDKTGALLGFPYHYRDPRLDGMMERAFEIVPRDEIFKHSGIQFLQINTLYQLLALRQSGSPLLDGADKLLMMGELFIYLLTGRQIGEFTNATTTQLYDPRKDAWSEYLFDQFDLPIEIMPDIVTPGSVVGELLPSVARRAGAGTIPVVAPAVHDTGSAFAGVPASDENWAVISSGTWSILGAELSEPLINDQSLECNFTNEGGVERTFRFLKNVMGLWLIQECRRSWERVGDSLDYPQIVKLATDATPFRSLVDPDHEMFLNPADMPEAIRSFCRETGQPVPEDYGHMARCVFESLALKYRYVLDRLESVTHQRMDVVHIVGGGSRNQLLNQLTADATGCPVVAGPSEATAFGNIIMQGIATGHIANLAEGRKLIRSSTSLESYKPRDRDAWEEAYARMVGLVKE